MGCLPGMPGPGRTPAARSASVIVLDMAAVVHIIKPQRVCGVHRNAIAAVLREHRLQRHVSSPKLGLNGVGLHHTKTRVTDKIPIPKGAQWPLFLKDELFQFISRELQRITVNSQYHLLTTKADIVLSNKPTYLPDLSPCRQEEADTRIMLHLCHAADQSYKGVPQDGRLKTLIYLQLVANTTTLKKL